MGRPREVIPPARASAALAGMQGCCHPARCGALGAGRGESAFHITVTLPIESLLMLLRHLTTLPDAYYGVASVVRYHVRGL